MSYVIAYDFGTGGIKASLFDSQAKLVCASFETYQTRFPQAKQQEQRPADWWRAFVQSTANLLAKSEIAPELIVSLGISGHSLGLVPLSSSGELLLEWTPIWSDARADQQAEEFFSFYSEKQWYLTSGNGFPAAHYPLFKLLWLRQHQADVYNKMSVFVGTKDYINYLLTGKIATDYSYASGSGAYDLTNWKYCDKVLSAANIPADIFPDIYPSDQVLGTILPEIATQLGLPASVQVVLGGVDNSCMALGAGNTSDGKAYNSLGSSSWIAVSSDQPILDYQTKPFVFTHVLPNMFTSATAIFSAGTSLNWYKQQLVEQLGNEVSFEQLADLAQQSKAGANGLIFIPHLAGGSSLDKTPKVKGSFIGLELKHTQADLSRAVFEGISFSLKVALDALAKVQDFDQQIRFVGGGSKSPFWMQLFANIFNSKVQTSSVNQQCAALGAAALAGVGAGIWQNYSVIDSAHNKCENYTPEQAETEQYQALYQRFCYANEHLAKIYQQMD